MARFHLEKPCAGQCLPVQERPVSPFLWAEAWDEASSSWDAAAFSVSHGSLGIIAALLTRSLFSQPPSPGVGPPISSPHIHCSLVRKKTIHIDFQIALPFWRDLPWDPLPAEHIPLFPMTCPVGFLQVCVLSHCLAYYLGFRMS